MTRTKETYLAMHKKAVVATATSAFLKQLPYDMIRTKETYLAMHKKAVTALAALDEARARPLSHNPRKAQQQWSEIECLLDVVRDLGREVATAFDLAQEACSAYKAEICSSSSSVSSPNTPLENARAEMTKTKSAVNALDLRRAIIMRDLRAAQDRSFSQDISEALQQRMKFENLKSAERDIDAKIISATSCAKTAFYIFNLIAAATTADIAMSLSKNLSAGTVAPVSTDVPSCVSAGLLSSPWVSNSNYIAQLTTTISKTRESTDEIIEETNIAISKLIKARTLKKPKLHNEAQVAQARTNKLEQNVKQLCKHAAQAGRKLKSLVQKYNMVATKLATYQRSAASYVSIESKTTRNDVINTKANNCNPEDNRSDNYNADNNKDHDENSQSNNNNNNSNDSDCNGAAELSNSDDDSDYDDHDDENNSTSIADQMNLAWEFYSATLPRYDCTCAPCTDSDCTCGARRCVDGVKCDCADVPEWYHNLFVQRPNVLRRVRCLLRRANVSSSNAVTDITPSFCSDAADASTIFAAFTHVPLHQVRVVVLGQDPLPRESGANGYAFCSDCDSVDSTHDTVAIVLQEMYNCTGDDIPKAHNRLDQTRNPLSRIINCNDTMPLSKHGQFLAEQGVLLLQSALTHANGDLRSHLHAWHPFTCAILRLIARTNPNVIVVALGDIARDIVVTSLHGVSDSLLCDFRSQRAAHEMDMDIYTGKCDEYGVLNDNVDANAVRSGSKSVLLPVDQVILAGNPSSSNDDLRTPGAQHQFIGSDVYRKVNHLLTARGKHPVRWLPAEWLGQPTDSLGSESMSQADSEQEQALKSRDKKKRRPRRRPRMRSKKTDGDADLNQGECANGNDNTLTYQQNDCAVEETGEEDMSEEEDSNVNKSN